jgi:phosphatidylinositol alpha-1,6-mannosyltransferase
VSILLISEVFPPKTGGSARWFWEIYRRLPRHNILIAAGEDKRQRGFDQSHEIRVYRTPLTMKAWGLRSFHGLFGYWRAVRRLQRLVRTGQVTVVHCGRCLPEGVMALALKLLCGTPYVCYVHGEDVNSASLSRELTWLARRVLHGAEFVIPNSRNTERILVQEWDLPAERLRLLYPGVDTKCFAPARRDDEVRDRLGWMDRTVLLTVGRLQKRKGHDHLILALKAIRQSIPNVLYAIVGDGDEHEYLRQLVASENLGNCVQFLDEVEDQVLRECYQQCDLFVLPNREIDRDIEGFGMVLLEAQACGRPVVAGMSGGTAETMRIPDTGRIVCCDRPEPLAALLVELLSDRDSLDRMGDAARSWVVEQFDWENLACQAARLFSLTSESCRPALEPA